MKKGLNSLDALMAFILVLFIVIFIQKASSINLMYSDAFGAQVQAESTASDLARVMNSFYAIRPETSDSVDVNGFFDIKFFGDFPNSVSISKPFGLSRVNVNIFTERTTYNVEFPVIGDVRFDQSTGLIEAGGSGP